MQKKSVQKVRESWKVEKKVTKEEFNSDRASATVRKNNCKERAGGNISITGILGDVLVIINKDNKERPS